MKVQRERGVGGFVRDITSMAFQISSTDLFVARESDPFQPSKRMPGTIRIDSEKISQKNFREREVLEALGVTEREKGWFW